MEFRDHEVSLYDQLISEMRNDITLLGSDLSSTPLESDRYPNHLHMLAFGMDSDPDNGGDRSRFASWSTAPWRRGG